MSAMQALCHSAAGLIRPRGPREGLPLVWSRPHSLTDYLRFRHCSLAEISALCGEGC